MPVNSMSSAAMISWCCTSADPMTRISRLRATDPKIVGKDQIALTVYLENGM
jgi:hypothetical protein